MASKNLALTHTPDPNRPTTRDYDPTDPRGGEFFWKLAPIPTPDPNRSTAINFCTH